MSSNPAHGVLDATLLLLISVPIWAWILIGAGTLLILSCCCYCICKRCICRKKKKKEGKKGLKGAVDLRNVALLGNSYKEKVGPQVYINFKGFFFIR